MSNFETIKILENSRKIIEIDGILLDVKNVSNFSKPHVLIEIETYNIGNFYISNIHPHYLGHSLYNNCDFDNFKSKLNKITHYLRNKNDSILSLSNNIDLKIDSNEVIEYFKKLEDLKLKHKTKMDEIQQQLNKILEERPKYKGFYLSIQSSKEKYSSLYNKKITFNQFLIENPVSIRNIPLTTFYKG